MSLGGRLAFVTGGGQGIGRATCKILSREGAAVVVADRLPKTVQETLNIINEGSKNQHLGIELDVGKAKSVEDALKQTLEKYSKPPTIIVNCAGITRDNLMLKLSEEDFDEVINVNLKGTFLVMKTFANSIAEHGIKNASIINISSVAAVYGNIGQTNYSASKAGVDLLSKSAAKELGKLGIRVNTIYPGIIKTRMTEAVPEKVKEFFKKSIPLGRLGEPEEVGEVIAFLASDKSSYLTGSSIQVSGGFSI